MSREELSKQYPMIVAPPPEYLDETYRGIREVGDCGVVLLLNGKAIFYGVLTVRYTGLSRSDVYIEHPETHIESEDELMALTKVGGFCLFKGKGKDAVIAENPETEQSKIEEKAKSALASLGIDDEDDF